MQIEYLGDESKTSGVNCSLPVYISVEEKRTEATQQQQMESSNERQVALSTNC